MSSKHRRLIAVAGVCLFALQAQFVLAAGTGHGHPSGTDHRHSTAGNSPTGLPAYANSWPYLRAENGIFGPVWAAPGPGSSFGGGGAGYGGGGYGGGGWGGWGYGLFDYDINPPYFDFYPPVYYSYNNGAVAPTPTPSAPVPGTGESAGQAAYTGYVPPGQSSPPLRIINPFYNSGK